MDSKSFTFKDIAFVCMIAGLLGCALLMANGFDSGSEDQQLLQAELETEREIYDMQVQRYQQAMSDFAQPMATPNTVEVINPWHAPETILLVIITIVVIGGVGLVAMAFIFGGMQAEPDRAGYGDTYNGCVVVRGGQAAIGDSGIRSLASQPREALSTPTERPLLR